MNEIDIALARKSLDQKQKAKLALGAKILKATCHLYDPRKPEMLPLWGGGVITHCQPKTRFFEIGITDDAEKADRKQQTRDHLYRVTETAAFILQQAEQLTQEEIEDILVSRSAKIVTTRKQNSGPLKRAPKECADKDDWKMVYEKAKIKFRLYTDDERQKRRKAHCK